MRRLAGWKQWAVFMLLVVPASLVAYHLGSQAGIGLRQQKQGTPLSTVNGLYIEPQSLDLGEIWETPRYKFQLKIQNVGSVPRSIARFQTTCGCLQLDPERQTIAAGAETDVASNLDLVSRQPYELGVARWPVSVRLDPVFEGDSSPTPGWEVKGPAQLRVRVLKATTGRVGSPIEVRPRGGWFVCEVSQVIPDKEIRIQYIEGVHRGTGRWTLEKVAEGTRVCYQIDLEPQGWLPRLLLQFLDLARIHSRSMEKVFDGLEKWLKGHRGNARRLP